MEELTFRALKLHFKRLCRAVPANRY